MPSYEVVFYALYFENKVDDPAPPHPHPKLLHFSLSNCSKSMKNLCCRRFWIEACMNGHVNVKKLIVLQQTARGRLLEF